jgi:hypothetical protein
MLIGFSSSRVPLIAAIDDAAVMGGDGWINEVAAQPLTRASVRSSVSAGEAAIADNIRDQDAASFRVSLIAPLQLLAN